MSFTKERMFVVKLSSGLLTTRYQQTLILLSRRAGLALHGNTQTDRHTTCTLAQYNIGTPIHKSTQVYMC